MLSLGTGGDGIVVKILAVCCLVEVRAVLTGLTWGWLLRDGFNVLSLSGICVAFYGTVFGVVTDFEEEYKEWNNSVDLATRNSFNYL